MENFSLLKFAKTHHISKLQYVMIYFIMPILSAEFGWLCDGPGEKHAKCT